MDEERITTEYVEPTDIDSEKAVLGSMLKNQDAVADVIDILKPQDFYLKEHQEIFKVMYDMFSKNIAIDLRTTFSELKSQKLADLVGGLTYLNRLSDEAIVSSNAKYYAAAVLDKSKMRQLIHEADKIRDAAYSNDMPPEDILDNAEQRIMEIAHNTQKQNYTDINEVFVENIKKIQELEKNKGKLPGIETGFRDVDKILGGLQKSDLIILAARPGAGKTAFALNIAEHAAKTGSKVMIFSLEMPNIQLGQRILSMSANVPMEAMRNGSVSPDEWNSISDAQDEFEKTSLVIDDSSVITPTEMKNKCRRYKAEKGGLDLVIIDYLQLMSLGGYKIEQREKEIGAITRAVKIMAKELDCAVILLSQLNRGPETRSGHKPQLSDLRDSGSIEQDADIVIFLKRDDYYEDDDSPASTDSNTGLTCQAIIAKHRNGATGTINLAWVPKYTKFGNLAAERDDTAF